MAAGNEGYELFTLNYSLYQREPLYSVPPILSAAWPKMAYPVGRQSSTLAKMVDDNSGKQLSGLDTTHV